MNASSLALAAARTIQFQIGIPGTSQSMAKVIEQEAIAPMFEQMPRQPDDMGSQEGLTAYVEAIAEWRAQMGYAEQYDGPVGPRE